MSRSLIFMLPLFGLLGCATNTQHLNASDSPSEGDLTPNIEHYTLSNGLDVYLLEDHSAPLFTFQYWVKVGSADEWEGSPGITGLSHFFEHMMFRGTEKYPSYFQEISSRGGQLNAFTWLDVTVYWEKLANTELEFVLDIESDRLANMRVDFLNLEPEREVVKSERLLRTENSPEGALREAMSASLFTDHSYHWPTVGWMRDLNAITVEQAQEYHRRFYVPNNAFIILVGDFETAEAKRLIEARFGSFENRPIERRTRTEDAPITSVRRTYVEKPTGTGLLHVHYQTPAGRSPDFVVLEVIEQLLTGGKTSRLEQALIHGEDPIARNVGSFLFPFVDPSVFAFDVELLPEKANRDAENRIAAEIERLRTEPVAASELERAVAQLRGSIVRSMTTTHNRAQMIGFSIRSTDDPALPWKRLQQYGEVTTEDIQRVANQWLNPTSRVIGNAVNPQSLVGLVQAWLEAHPSTTPDLDALIQEYTALAAGFAEANAEARSIQQEDEAIQFLAQRGEQERTRLAGDAEALAALDTYLSEGDKGPVKRGEVISQRKEALAAGLAELQDKRQKLDQERAALETADADANRQQWVSMLSVIIQPSASDNTVAARPSPAEESTDRALGDWALQLLTRQHFAGPTATGVAARLAARAPAEGALRDIWNFAHIAQRVDAGRM